MRTSDDYDELLAGFRALHVQVGRRLFNLQWHNVSLNPKGLVFSSPDKDGGYGNLEWPGVADGDRPFDVAKRQIVGQLCLPMDDNGERFTLGLDVVTIPKGGVAEEPVSDDNGTLGKRFVELSARAGAALPVPWRDWLSGFISVADNAPANWWYALLFALYDDSLMRVGRGVVGELDLRAPLSCAADIIDRLGLNTDQPKLPADVLPTSGASSPPPTAKPDEGEEKGGENHPATNPPGKPSTQQRQKRSTERGEGRAKIIAAIAKHHEYDNGGCLNQNPIGVRPLARLADVDPSTVTDFFNREFDNRGKEGRTKYRAICRDSGKLADCIKALRGEFAPHELYGRQPPDEDDRDDEE